MGKTELLAPGGRVGRYHLVHRLACGGMAELHVACAGGVGGFEKMVALKRVLPHLAVDPRFTAMFLNEARLAANLDHPNIVQVMDIGEVEGDFYYVMEYVHGRDGRALLREAARHGGLSLPCAISAVLDAASGLHYAHERVDVRGDPLGIVHRDVSPSNVLLSYDGVLKIADFGIAKASARQDETLGSTMKGKIGYMSPEQCSGRPVDRRSDVFGLGILLYEFTTSKRLFYGDSDFEILNRIVRGEYDPPSDHVVGYPASLAGIVDRALRTDPAERFPTAKALRDELESFAHEARMRCGQSVLGETMTALFGTPPFPRIEVRPPPVSEKVQLPTLVFVTEAAAQGDASATKAWRGRPWLVGLAVGAAVALGWYAGSSRSPSDDRGTPLEAPAELGVSESQPKAPAAVIPAPGQLAETPKVEPKPLSEVARKPSGRPRAEGPSPRAPERTKKPRARRKKKRAPDMGALYPK